MCGSWRDVVICVNGYKDSVIVIGCNQLIQLFNGYMRYLIII